MFNPDQPRDEIGRWTDTGINAATEIHTNMDATKGLQGAASDEVDIMMWRAKESAGELQQAALALAAEFGGNMVPINFKGKERIIEKAKDDYGGDISKVKDAVRTTVMVEYSQMNAVAERLKADPRMERVKIQNGSEYYGYKGILVNMKTANGLSVEIQVNSPGMLYAKEKKEKALGFMSENKYNEIAAKTGLPGGRGHKLYDEIRVIVKPVEGSEQYNKRNTLIKESEEYYRNFYDF